MKLHDRPIRQCGQIGLCIASVLCIASIAQETQPDRESGLPSFRPLWHVPTTVDYGREQLLAAQLLAHRTRGTLVLPQQRPMIIGDYAITRTLYQVVGVDIKTGRRIFVFPFSELLGKPRRLRLSPFEAAYQKKYISQAYAQRMFANSLYHTLATDGEDAFLIDGIPMNPAIQIQFASPADEQSAQAKRSAQAAKYNRLVSLSVEKQGRLNWIVGSESGEDEPALARAVFHGGPVVDKGQLFAVALMEDDIRLVCLDAKTGKLRWSVSVGVPEVKPAPITTVHQLLGASLAVNRDLVICRFEGVITCIDRKRRKRLWQRVPKVEDPGGPFGPMATRMVAPGHGWTDNRVHMSGNYVISASGTVGPLECLDMATGELKWQQPREKMVAVAALSAGRLIVLQTNGVRAIDVRTGKDSWPGGTVALPGGAIASGRGVVINGNYLQPTTNSEVVNIDMKSGQIFERAETEFVLGNLAAAEDRLYSQNADKLAVFWRTSALKKKVEAQLAENPNDLWALAQQSELAVQHGRWKQAAASFKRAAALAPQDAAVRATLAIVGTHLLKHDFSLHKQLAGAIDSLCDATGTRQRLHVLLVEGWIAEKDYPKARSALMATLPTIEPDGSDELIRAEPHRSVRHSRWFRETLRKIDASEAK